MTDSTAPKTLYVGNLDESVSEDLLCALFSRIGVVRGCKIIRESGNDSYAFVEFADHMAASAALTALNQRLFFEKQLAQHGLPRILAYEFYLRYIFDDVMPITRTDIEIAKDRNAVVDK